MRASVLLMHMAPNRSGGPEVTRRHELTTLPRQTVHAAREVGDAGGQPQSTAEDLNEPSADIGWVPVSTDTNAPAPRAKL